MAGYTARGFVPFKRQMTAGLCGIEITQAPGSCNEAKGCLLKIRLELPPQFSQALDKVYLVRKSQIKQIPIAVANY